MELNKTIVFPNSFSVENWTTYFDTCSTVFEEKQIKHSIFDDELFSNTMSLGRLAFEDCSSCHVFMIKVQKSLSERSCRRKQFEKATLVIKGLSIQAGLYIFYDAECSFRFSLVYPVYKGSERRYSNYRRHSFFVSDSLSNKTYFQQLSQFKLNSMKDLKDAFSVDKVSDLFYKEFKEEYDQLQHGIFNIDGNEPNNDLKADFALLFVIRIIFLGFVQKKGWLGNRQNFLKDYIASYNPELHSHSIYQDLLLPLFFTALNTAPDNKNDFTFSNISEPYKTCLVKAPYLNGGLFRKHENCDLEGLYITDDAIKQFISFLFSFNFTLEENTLYDEELELNPEFLGIIFEKLVNKADGAIYTPRLEVDFMCRLSLVKYLQQNCQKSITLENLYKLFFPEYGDESEQTCGEFTPEEAIDLLDKLETVTVCDPAIGSGAFAVGMLNVLDEIECSIHHNFLSERPLSKPYERKKRIIFQSLYGVEVKQWAVWISQLRLWITLLIEADDSFKDSVEPLLPSFDFKIRQGDSLIQMIGSELFPVSGEGIIAADTRKKIAELVKLKTEYYYNKCPNKLHEIEQNHKALYISILDKKKKELLIRLTRYKAETTKEVQANLFNPEIQGEIDCFGEQQKKDIEKLEVQIHNVDCEIGQITAKNLPFIWRIDFPEIFIEKGGFDIVIGNPPYLHSGKIEDPVKRLNSTLYKKKLRNMVEIDFPNFLRESNIDGRSDLYTFFYVRGLRLLNAKGFLTYICSNSWLDVEYGFWLQKLVFEKCHLHFVLNNQVQRSFKRADINTIISVIGSQRLLQNHKSKFVTLKLTYEESIYTENLLLMEETQRYTDYSDIKVFPTTSEEITTKQHELFGNIGVSFTNEEFSGTKLGSLYLAAPELYWETLLRNHVNLRPLQSYFSIKRGLTTNCVKFFFIDTHKMTYPIEKEYVIPIITSSQSIRSLIFDNDKLLFFCHDNKENLRNTNALRYINEWENEYPTASTNNDVESMWYSVQHEKAELILFRFWDKRFFTPTSSEDMLASDNFFIGYKLKFDKEAILALLNCTFFFWQIEILGRKNQGQGILTTYGPEYEYIRIPDMSLFDIDELKNAFRCLCKRDVYDYRTEVKQADKKILDNIVFDALGLSLTERQDLIESYVSLVDIRLSKAASLKNK